MKAITSWILFSCSFVSGFFVGASTTQADTFGSGTNQFEIVFVDIGNANNPDDTTGSPNPAGKVEYAYRMGKFEISRDMVTKANNEGSLGITMDSMGVVTGGPRADMPATGVTWLEAAKFVNWLNMSRGHQAAYKFDSTGSFQIWSSAEAWQVGGENLFRHRDAYYFLPSVDEWYKSAYFDPSSDSYFDYPTGSDSFPSRVGSGTAAGTAVYQQPTSQGPADISLSGGLSPYGTMGQGGNVWEWEETEFDLNNNSASALRDNRGGSWNGISLFLLASERLNARPTDQLNTIGFRVASIPEPSTVLLATLAMGGLFVRRRR
jgi:formylglycine-generating enzyme required for sulfatase activity